jgi:hypothetical protein
MAALRSLLPILLALAAIHCSAGRSELGSYVDEANTTIVDASLLAADTSRTLPDSSMTVNEASAPCTQPVFVSSLAGDYVSCKFHVSWTCGTTKYEAGGGCAPPGSKPGFGSGIMGGCLKDGAPTGSINDPDPNSCSCTDGTLTFSTVVKACGFPIHG